MGSGRARKKGYLSWIREMNRAVEDIVQRQEDKARKLLGWEGPEMITFWPVLVAGMEGSGQ